MVLSVPVITIRTLLALVVYIHFFTAVEHTFEVSVEGIKGLQLLDTMTWGEADCFIQYHFPVQTHTTQQGGPKILHGRSPV